MGFPATELTAAILSTNEEQEAPSSPISAPAFTSYVTLSSTQQSLSTTISSESVSLTATATVAAQPTTDMASPPREASTGKIAGGIAGGIVALVMSAGTQLLAHILAMTSDSGLMPGSDRSRMPPCQDMGYCCRKA
ncbi:hypothetical protein MMC28_003132 [Mycoblastus sanguinarius]|nr:hypothetical protein [Mycoblastus sanguinarius]